MKPKKFVCALICVVLLASALATLVGCDSSNVTSDSLYVKRVSGIGKDFVMGMDASSVISLEKGGVKFYDFDGNEADVFKVLADNGINTIRVRVWNNPYDSNGNGFGGGNCDIDNAIAIGKRATQYGMGLMVDFHYSDFWADPAKQKAPEAWKGMSTTPKSEALYAFTKECLEKLKAENVKVSMVQVGNETNGKMCGETSWANIAKLMNAGSKAVREIFPKALVVLHFANPEKVTNYQDYAKQLKNYKVDYDVFASSYYPYWHGTLENLSTLLSEIAEQYGKKVMVAETSYAFTGVDSDFGGNTIGEGSAVTKNYPYTVQGQANCMRDIIDCMAHTKNGIGVCYWEGTWISAGGKDWEANKALWEKYGSGWAADAAGSYDPDVRQYGGGGTQVDNQTFFDSTGHPLESLKVFALVKKGNSVENKADAIEDTLVIGDLKGTVTLPKKVNAVMLDDSKQELDVTWNITDAQMQALYLGGVKKYEFTGTAGGMTARLTISMVNYNYVQNYSFEEDNNFAKEPKHWTVTANKTPDELYVKSEPTNSLTGNNNFHFWGSASASIDFSLEQELANVPAGVFTCSASIMGGDTGASEAYVYIKINGTIAYQSENIPITKWNEWHTGTINNIQYNGTDKIVIGVYVKCASAGAWGDVDDILFNVMGD